MVVVRRGPDGRHEPGAEEAEEEEDEGEQQLEEGLGEEAREPEPEAGEEPRPPGDGWDGWTRWGGSSAGTRKRLPQTTNEMSAFDCVDWLTDRLTRPSLEEEEPVVVAHAGENNAKPPKN